MRESIWILLLLLFQVWCDPESPKAPTEKPPEPVKETKGQRLGVGSSLADLLLSTESFTKEYNNKKKKTGTLTLAGELDEIVYEPGSEPVPEDNSSNDSINIEESHGNLGIAIYAWWRGLRLYLIELISELAPKNILRYIKENKGTAVHSILGVVGIVIILVLMYWIFKLPQLLLAVFQVYSASFPRWISIPMMVAFAMICLAYTVANGDLYRFYADLYHQEQVTLYFAVLLGISQMFIRALWSVAVAFLSFTPFFIITRIYDSFYSRPTHRLKRESIMKELKDQGIVYYLNKFSTFSIIFYAVLSLCIREDLIKREFLYDLQTFEMPKDRRQ